MSVPKQQWGGPRLNESEFKGLRHLRKIYRAVYVLIRVLLSCTWVPQALAAILPGTCQGGRFVC